MLPEKAEAAQENPIALILSASSVLVA
jgi:hypothetical protein